MNFSFFGGQFKKRPWDNYKSKGEKWSFVSTTLLKVTNILFALELLQFWCFNGHMCVRTIYEVNVESR